MGVLPVIAHPVTKYETVYTAMKNLQEILHYLDQSHLPVTCDKGIYQITWEIQLNHSEEFTDLVLCMGSFHMAKIALGCPRKYIKGSSAGYILVESCLFCDLV